MDLSEVGAEIGSCGHRWEGKRTKEMQNRPEVRSLSMDRAREGGYGGELEGWGHPPNVAGSSIEGEQKFGGWICPNWA